MDDKAYEVYKRTMALADHHRRTAMTRRRMIQLSAAGSIAAITANFVPRDVYADVSGTLVHFSASGKRLDGASRAVIPLFQKIYPNVEIELASIPMNEFERKTLTTMANKSDTYDTILVDYGFCTALDKMGAMVPLQPYVDQDPEWYEDYVSDVSEAYRLFYNVPLGDPNGTLYGLAFDGNVNIQYYRKDVFEKKGLKPPLVWDEVLDVVKELHDPDNDVYGFAAHLKRDFWAGIPFYAIMLAHGGNWFDKNAPGGWNPQFESEAGYQALNYLTQLKPFAHPLSANAGEDEINTTFADGSSVYSPTSMGAAVVNDPSFSRHAADWFFEIAPRGANPEGVHKSISGGFGNIIPSYASNHDLAFLWTKFMCSGDRDYPEIGDAQVAAGGQPARMRTLERYRVQKPYLDGLMRSYPYVVPWIVNIPEGFTIMVLIGEETADAFNGIIDIETALKNMDKKVRRLMEKSGYYG